MANSRVQVPEAALIATSVRVRVHERGERGLDAVLRLIEMAASERPLDHVLTAMCADVGEVCGADVVSVYVREVRPDGDWLILRANIGFPKDSVGRVALRVGEGITGFIAECMRPISVRAAHEDEHYKHIPGLGEENVPVYLGVPLMRESRSIGVLVLQRRDPDDIRPYEVPLLAALAAPFGFALENAERRKSEHRSRSRFARLRGTPLSPGIGMGKAIFVPTLASLAQSGASAGDAGDTEYNDVLMAAAWARLDRDLELARSRLARAPDLDNELACALANATLFVQDQRFRDRVVDEWQHAGLCVGLTTVARSYARVPYRLPPGNEHGQLTERARDIEDLCVLIYAAVVRERLLPGGGVWIADRLGSFIGLCAVARRASAVVIDGPVDPTSSGARLVRAGRIPVLTDVHGLFACAQPGDLLAADAGAGVIRVNPAASAVAEIRHARSDR